MAYTVRSISSLKEQINILDVVSAVVPLKKTGSSYKGVCPFHNEKTPSFNVNEVHQRFYCFGCNASGDAIEFVKKYYNLEFNEAVELLAKQYGIELEESKTRGENLDKYYEINKDAATFFYKAFTETKNIGYAYMKKRGIEPNMLKRFGIGYADAEWDSLYEYLKSRGHDEKDMLDMGLISKRNDKCFDKFRNRVMFPIINVRGKVIGFGGRALSSEDNPKYLNSQESKVFLKKNNLYGINIARQSVNREGYIILVEGYMDTIALAQAGIDNVAASLGTALTENQARMIKRYAKKVILCYDSDAAGRTAALRGMEILRKEGLDVRVMHVTDGKDPDEYIKMNGKDAFLDLLSKAKHYGEYKIENSILGLNPDDHNDRIQMIKNISSVLAGLTPGEREEYAGKYSSEYNISKAVLLEESKTSDGGREERNIRKPEKTDEPREELSQIEKQLIRLVLLNEKFIEKTKENSEILSTETSKRIFDIISQNVDNERMVDIDKIIDQLDEDDRTTVYDILNNVVILEDEDDLFRGLVQSARIKSIRDEINRINEVIKYAGDADASGEEMKSLMQRSMELQSMLAKEKSEVN